MRHISFGDVVAIIGGIILLGALAMMLPWVLFVLLLGMAATAGGLWMDARQAPPKMEGEPPPKPDGPKRPLITIIKGGRHDAE